MSGAFLSIAKDGEPSSQGEAREAGANQLFGLLVADPWAVLEFGGLDHCVKAGGGEEPESVAVQPLPAGAARRLESGEEVTAAGKTCVENLRRYGPHFLRFEPGSKEREEEFEALSEGDSSKLPEADPGKGNGTYELGPADRPAASAMEKGGQYQRLLVAIVVFAFELGAFFLLGALALGVITAQVLLLLLLAFSPVALVAAAIPGSGHQFFKGWLAKLAGFLLRKAAYSLVLAILLAVCAAISAATSELGWLFSFGLQCAFFWAVFLQRRSLTEGLVGAVAGPGSPGGERALKVLALYSGARLGARTVSRPARTVGSRLRRGRAGEGTGSVAAAASPQGGPGGSDAARGSPTRRAPPARGGPGAGSGRGRGGRRPGPPRGRRAVAGGPGRRTARPGRGDGDGRPDVARRRGAGGPAEGSPSGGGRRRGRPTGRRKARRIGGRQGFGGQGRREAGSHREARRRAREVGGPRGSGGEGPPHRAPVAPGGEAGARPAVGSAAGRPVASR